MNRFQRGNGQLLPKETTLKFQSGVRLYDGDQATNFDKGTLILTNYRLLWKNEQQQNEELSLQLSLVILAEEESGGWNRSAKIKLHLNCLPSFEMPTGPIIHSPFNFVKLSFREGGQSEFLAKLREVQNKKDWESMSSSSLAGPKFRPGIVGIERAIQAKNEQADRSIVTAFEDLKRLMEMAKDMVAVARSISQKIRDKQGDISEDETVIFKSQLLSLGISDPVTKDACDSSLSYYKELAKQLALILEKPVQEAGGMLALTDIYCHVNRARGLELLSPDDLLNGCKMFASLGLPLRLQIFDSGVKVVQLAAHDNVRAAKQIEEMLSEKGSLSTDELAFQLGTSIVLAKERLLYAEKEGLACRDDSVEGMRFYPNRFLTDRS